MKPPGSAKCPYYGTPKSEILAFLPEKSKINRINRKDFDVVI